MTDIKISIPEQQPELEVAIATFVQEEFNQQAVFKKEPPATTTHKDASLLSNIMQHDVT